MKKINPPELIGHKVNRWTIIKYLGNDKSKRALFEYQCECGTIQTKSYPNPWSVSKECFLCQKRKRVNSNSLLSRKG